MRVKLPDRDRGSRKEAFSEAEGYFCMSGLLSLADSAGARTMALHPSPPACVLDWIDVPQKIIRKACRALILSENLYGAALER